MTTETPAAVLRAAAALLREAASHATPGPWRTHDTHLGGTGGHTATVLTDRPNINDTDLVAWLPTMSHEPWDEARNAWRNAGWIALMDPSVGLALADWLEQAAKAHDATIIGAASVWRQPEEAAERDAWVAKQTDHAALVVAHRILGTTEQADTVTAPTVDRATEVARLRAENAELGRQLACVRGDMRDMEAYVREQDAEFERLPVGLAAVLREAADEIAGINFHPNARARSLDIATGLARRLRRLAAEAQQPTPAVVEAAVCGDSKHRHTGPCALYATPAPTEETKR